MAASKNVYELAQERLELIFREFDTICVSFSGGKDSTATVILAHENNEPLDLILFCEVMFDESYVCFIWIMRYNIP